MTIQNEKAYDDAGGKGRVYFLNGLTSSGKTSLIDELRRRDEFTFFTLGYDMFEETMSTRMADNDIYYKAAVIAVYQAAKSFSDSGYEVLIDGLIMNIGGLEEHYAKLLDIFGGYPLSVVNLHCPIELCRKRNLLRGNRRELQSDDQLKISEKNVAYAFDIDTGSHNVGECADIFMQNRSLLLL